MNYKEFLLEINSKCAGKNTLQLDNFIRYCNNVNNPQKQLSGIHIGGTNGKGSTGAMVEAILFAHGFKVGLNTSPHLVNYQERFRLNKKELSESEILNIYQKYHDIMAYCDISFFEISTAIAFHHFHEVKVDYAIMEVGMGGRLDATKLINSEISAITSIDFDHTKSLGNRLEKIAWQKAGIIKKNTPTILGKMSQSAIDVFFEEARKMQAPVLLVEKEIKTSNVKMEAIGNKLDFTIPKYNLEFKNVYCNLSGRYQLSNLSTAMLICAELSHKHNWILEEEKVKAGLSRVIWKGRMETISENPKIIVDGAHNPASIEELAYNLCNIYKFKNLVCVISILYDKDYQLMIKKLSKVVDCFIICQSKSERAATTIDLSREAEKYKNVIIEKDIKTAIAKAEAISSQDDLICVTGSLYTIGEALK